MSLVKLKKRFFEGSFINNVKDIFKKLNEVIDYLNGIGTSGDGSYRIYCAILTQSGTDDPIPIVLSNTIGDVVWTREQTGNYKATLTGAFTLNKTFTLISNDGSAGSMVGANPQGQINYVSIKTSYYEFAEGELSPIYVDGINKVSIEIRVYN